MFSLDRPNELRVTDEFVGVRVRLSLEKNGDETQGWAHPHFDGVKLIPRAARGSLDQ
jgi:hypothetical protein